ncbi:TrbC/VirB2 family protein [Ensifer sp. SL37]|uniref:TrbC/VirB2 family protein n=1 Tax=Ensifer sp. SL37 TaxID=2995137 RepID=UPI0022733C78|nr:TrbC/VirB2 family protein [Ensifer sp. SL37]MCY1741000.1 TrbC/VirB2 family protein [Ensifer sp. SL37]
MSIAIPANARPARATGLNLHLADAQAGFITRTAVFMAIVFAMWILMMEPAAAQQINLNPVTTFLTSITTALTGTLGKTIATLALIGVAITWFFGVIDFRQAMWVIVAIVFVGSASTIVSSLWAS